MSESKYRRKASGILNKIMKSGKFKVYRFTQGIALQAHTWVELPTLDNIENIGNTTGLRIGIGHKSLSINNKRHYCRVSDLLSVGDSSQLARLIVRDRIGVVV